MMTRRGGGASGRTAAGGGVDSASAAGAAALGDSAAPTAWDAAAAMMAPGIAGTGAAETVAAAVAGAGGLAATTGPAAAAGRPSTGAAAVAEAGAVTGGFTTTGPAGGLAAMAGVCDGGAATTPVRVELAARPSRADGRHGRAAGALAAREGVGPGRATTGMGVVAGGAAGRGVAGWASCCFLSRICLAISPGLWAWDQSIFGLLSASCRAALLLPPRALRMCVRTRSASSVSIELEWVFFSVTPTAVRASRISLLLTSSSRANSLIRTVLIRPRVVRNSHRSLALHTDNS